MAHVCVSTTARQAEQRGYEVLLAEDGIGDRDIPGATGEKVTKMVMNELGDAFGKRRFKDRVSNKVNGSSKDGEVRWTIIAWTALKINCRLSTHSGYSVCCESRE